MASTGSGCIFLSVGPFDRCELGSVREYCSLWGRGCTICISGGAEENQLAQSVYFNIICVALLERFNPNT